MSGVDHADNGAQPSGGPSPPVPSSVPSPLPPPPTLPIANISRLMKLAIPPSCKISSGAKDVMADCTCEFIAFITSEANDRCDEEKRKTINGDDILYALKVLGFEDYETVCRIWLSRIRMSQDAQQKQKRQGSEAEDPLEAADDPASPEDAP